MGNQTDPRMGTPSWRAIRAYYQTQRPTQCEAPICLLPGRPITYGPRCPTSLDVGHIESRATDERTQWLLSDCRPEHARCNRSAGAALRKRPTEPLNYSDPQW